MLLGDIYLPELLHLQSSTRASGLTSEAQWQCPPLRRSSIFMPTPELSSLEQECRELISHPGQHPSFHPNGSLVQYLTENLQKPHLCLRSLSQHWTRQLNLRQILCIALLGVVFNPPFAKTH